MTWYQEWFGEEYLELYAHRDEAEARRQVSFFRSQVGLLPGKVLDLACGSGRHLDELSEQGYSAVGCDLSFILLSHGRSQQTHRLTRADMRRLPFAEGAFAGLVNFFTSFGYFETERDNQRTVEEMSRVLSPAAKILFDYLNVDRELRRLVPAETRQIEGGVVEIERWFDETSRTFNKRMRVGDRSFLERVRGYRQSEIIAFFEAAGFQIDDFFGDFDGSAFTSDSPRLILVGRKL